MLHQFYHNITAIFAGIEVVEGTTIPGFPAEDNRNPLLDHPDSLFFKVIHSKSKVDDSLPSPV